MSSEQDNSISNNQSSKQLISSNCHSDQSIPPCHHHHHHHHHHHSNLDYLNENQILKWFACKSIKANFIIHDNMTYAYVISLGSIYDNWFRENYIRKLWKTYLKLGQNGHFWAPEVLQSTQTFDKNTNLKLIKEKVRASGLKIRSLSNDYLKCSMIFKEHRERNDDKQITKQLLELSGLHHTEQVFSNNKVHHLSMKKLKKTIRDYVLKCNRPFRKSIDSEIQFVQYQAGHFELMKDFMKTN